MVKIIAFIIIISKNRYKDQRMLARLAPKFLIPRIIQNSYLAENQTIQLLKIPLGEHFDYYNSTNPEDYQTVKFYGYLSKTGRPEGFANKYEERAYDEACQRFKNFNQTLQVYEKLVELQSQAHMLYNYIERNNSSSNFFSRRLQTDKDFQKDIIDGIVRYRQLQQALAPYPEWQQKAKEQIGGMYHLIHNNLNESEAKRRIFEKLNRQEYFL